MKIEDFSAAPSPSHRSSPTSTLSAAARHRLDSGDEAAFDALTDLFLGDPVATSRVDAKVDAEGLAAASRSMSAPNSFDESRQSSPTITASAPLIECIVLGHLPVLGSAWASQYAREVAAAARRTVASLRFDDDLATIELIDDPSCSSQIAAAPVASSFEEAVRIARAHAARWIVRGDASTEQELAADDHVRMITLLSGVDEAARVAGYAAVKSLAPKLPPPLADGLPLIRVAMMGSNADRGAAAADRIVDAVRKFLGRDAQRADCSSQIRSGRTPRLIFSGECRLQIRDALELVARSAGPDIAEAPLVSDPDPDPRVAIEEPLDPIDASARAAATDWDHLDPPSELTFVPPQGTEDRSAEPGSESPAPHADSRHSPALGVDEPAPEVADHPIAESVPAPRADPILRNGTSADQGSGEAPSAESRCSTEPPPLHTFVPDLTPIRIRCPHARSVEFALDHRGRPHVLVQCDDGSEATGVMLLTIASGWFAENAEAFGFAQASLLTLHLFTPAPRRVRPLLWSNLRLYLLKPVPFRESGVWCCEPLN